MNLRVWIDGEHELPAPKRGSRLREPLEILIVSGLAREDLLIDQRNVRLTARRDIAIDLCVEVEEIAAAGVQPPEHLRGT